MQSQNGWSASSSLAIRALVVAGESFSPGIRDDDDVETVLRYVAEQVHERVEPIVRSDWHQADDWGFYYRANANDPNSLSNHSSGTAFDYNATRHPNGVPTSQTFTAAQVAEIHTILRELDGAVRWGGDYTGTPDAMHFEINTTPAALATVAGRIRQGDDDMADYAAQLDRIEEQAKNSRKRDREGRSAERKIARAQAEQMGELLNAVAAGDGATREAVRKGTAKILAAIDEAEKADSGDVS